MPDKYKASWKQYPLKIDSELSKGNRKDAKQTLYKWLETFDDNYKPSTEEMDEFKKYQDLLRKERQMAIIKRGGLEKTAMAASLIAFITGLFFFSIGITGNVISNLNQNSSIKIGVLLIVLGVIFGYFWIKKHKK